MSPLQRLQRRFDMEGRGYEQLRADLRALGEDEEPFWIGLLTLASLFIVVAIACAALPDIGAV